MIKPPFTLLILKSPHRPVTIRVSVTLFILLIAVLPVLSGAAGYGLFLLFSSGFTGRIHSPALVAQQPSGEGVRELSGKLRIPTPPEISGLFITSARGGGTDIIFSLSNTAPGKKYFLWIVANPDAAGSDGACIHPRNPVFRGLPVDYRNGIPCERFRGEITINIGKDEPHLTVEKLRILVYSAEGKILTDKQFTVGQDKRSSSP